MVPPWKPCVEAYSQRQGEERKVLDGLGSYDADSAGMDEGPPKKGYLGSWTALPGARISRRASVLSGFHKAVQVGREPPASVFE